MEVNSSFLTEEIKTQLIHNFVLLQLIFYFQ